MAVYGAFTPSMMSMMAQSTAMDNIGANIANVNTGGYKRTDMRFATVLSDTINTTSDIGGVRPNGAQRIDLQGNVVSTSRNMDAAITGSGFFVLNSERNGTGETIYTRDGNFQTVPGDPITVPSDDGNGTITTYEAYLADSAGNYVMGWSPNADGSFNTNQSMSAMRVDTYAFTDSGIGTTENRLSLNLPSDASAGTQHDYNMQVFDSNGNGRTITLGFEKSSTIGEWTVTPTWQDDPVAQVDTLTMGGTVEAGDVYSATVNGTTVSYTVTGSEANLAEIRNNLLTAINADSAITADVTAAASGTNAITLTSNTAGTPITTSFTAQGVTDTAQVDTVALTGTPTAGDVYSVDVDGNTVSYTATVADTTMAAVRDGLRAAINGDTTVSALVTAADSGTQDLTLTANATGTPFTATATNTSATATTSSSTTTNSYSAVNDNTAASATTTANSDGTFTGTTTTMTFGSDAALTSPTSLNIAATWADGSTLDTDLDMTEVTQYAGHYTPYNYWQNGHGKGQLREFSFDASGNVQGSFTNSQTRPLYRMGLAVFANPNGLEMISDNKFKQTELSGSANLVSAGEGSYATITGNSLEFSNVDVAQEFSNMIVTQQAYNSSATVFRTVDEMTTTARDLKS